MTISDPSNSHIAHETHSTQKELQKLNDDFNDETRWYHEQLRKLEDEYYDSRLRPLYERQADLARMLNSKQALTKDLPPETMSLIFQEAYAMEGSAVFLWIGRVSADWRQIAWSTPQLWTRMDVDVSPDNLRFILSLLRLHLNNVKGLCLSLSLQFSPPQNFAAGLLHALVKLLSDRESARKIRSLSFDNPPQQLAPLLSNGLGCFSHLEDLKILAWDPLELLLVGLSSLQVVTLSRVDLVMVESSFPTVTSLRLTFAPINKVLQFILRCPNLVSVAAYALDPVTGMDWEEITEVITLHHLERITWVFNSDPTSLNLFRRIHTPCLQSFECQYIDDEEVALEGPALYSFADSFPSTLVQLTFRWLNSWPPGFFERVFARTTRLESLNIEGFERDTVAGMISVLHSGPMPETLFLPCLKELTVSDSDEDIFDDELQWGICGFLERRWHSGVNHFILNLSEIEWDPRSQEGILALVEAGFNLQLYECGEIPAWFDVEY